MGTAAALADDTVAVGWPSAKKVLLFRRGPRGWGKEAALGKAAADQRFGEYVQLDGARLVVAAAPGLTTFERRGKRWARAGRLLFEGTNLGGPFALAGDLLVTAVGSLVDTSVSPTPTLLVFERQHGRWLFSSELLPRDAPPLSRLGTSLSADGKRVVATARSFERGEPPHHTLHRFTLGD